MHSHVCVCACMLVSVFVYMYVCCVPCPCTVQYVSPLPTCALVHMWSTLSARLATIMQHAMLAARTLIAHSSAESERATLLGHLVASFGLGYILGPAVGGLLSTISLPSASWVTAALSLLALTIVQLGLPTGKHCLKRQASEGRLDRDLSGLAGCCILLVSFPCCHHLVHFLHAIASAWLNKSAGLAGSWALE